MAMPRSLSVSVLVTCYNYRDFIVEAVESALCQTHSPMEVIVVDDGSTDGSADVLRKSLGHDSRLSIVSKTNGGQMSAFCAGVAEARGQVIAFLDADDLWEANYLERIVATYLERPSVDFVYTNMTLFGGMEGLWHKQTESRDDGISVIQASFLFYWRGSPTSAVSMRREHARRVVWMPRQLQLDWRTRADDCLVVGSDILAGHKFYLGEALVRYRAHDGNVWLGTEESRIEAQKRWQRVHGLMAFYRQRAGIDLMRYREHLQSIKREFREKQNPPEEEYRIYAALARKTDLRWDRKLRMRWKLWTHFRRTRNTSVNRD